MISTIGMAPLHLLMNYQYYEKCFDYHDCRYDCDLYCLLLVLSLLLLFSDMTIIVVTVIIIEMTSSMI